MSVKMFSHFVPIGKTIWTISSPDDNILVLWGITPTKGTMMIESVVVASSPWGAWLMHVFTNIRYEQKDVCMVRTINFKQKSILGY